MLTNNQPLATSQALGTLLLWTVVECVHNLFNIQIVNPLILSRQGIKVSTLTKYSKHARNLLVTLVVLRPDTLSKELTNWFDQFEI